jgi:hypothetical protein
MSDHEHLLARLNQNLFEICDAFHIFQKIMEKKQYSEFCDALISINWESESIKHGITIENFAQIFINMANFYISQRGFRTKIFKSEAYNIRHSFAYKEWVKDVFTRDNFTCQICGKHGGQLNAHHIKPFAKYPELRLIVSNGITLCKDCHMKYHKEHRV